jgi:hypothetical protein
LQRPSLKRLSMSLRHAILSRPHLCSRWSSFRMRYQLLFKLLLSYRSPSQHRCQLSLQHQSLRL